MSQVKLPYYPKVEAQMHVTPFGAVEISVPQIYDTPLQNKVIVKVDTLCCLDDVFTNECFICRDFLYAIMAGDYRKYNITDVFASYYRRFSSVREYVNDRYFYGDNEVPMLERCILPLRERVNSFKDKTVDLMCGAGGKYLTHTHDYLYFSFSPSATIPEYKGVEIIC